MTKGPSHPLPLQSLPQTAGAPSHHTRASPRLIPGDFGPSGLAALGLRAAATHASDGGPDAGTDRNKGNWTFDTNLTRVKYTSLPHIQLG